VAIADWMLAHVPDGVWQSREAGVEIGAGAGLLMRELQGRFPGKPLLGVEPNRHAAAEGRSRGFDIRASMDDLPAIDVVWAVAVLEHVESPTEFLRTIRSRLDEGGTLVLIQPSGDVPSYDVLFIDHLHHFARAHLAAYARKCGFDEMRSTVGHPLMPNFSLHVWRASLASDGFEWHGPPAVSHCRTAARHVLAAMARLDGLLERLETTRRRVAAFGVREVFALARSYSTLDAFPLACGFDDRPEELETVRFPFPIVRPEAAPRFGITDALLTMNTLYYEQARRRCESLGLVCHPVLDAEPVE
jgi:SAM-dependent methyltransferase